MFLRASGGSAPDRRSETYSGRSLTKSVTRVVSTGRRVRALPELQVLDEALGDLRGHLLLEDLVLQRLALEVLVVEIAGGDRREQARQEQPGVGVEVVVVVARARDLETQVQLAVEVLEQLVCIAADGVVAAYVVGLDPFDRIEAGAQGAIAHRAAQGVAPAQRLA